MITIVNTGIGNFKSIKNMLLRIGVSSCLSAEAQEIHKANKIILPGVGSFDTGMASLKKQGLINVLKDKAHCENTKILGICLGMQFLANASEEGDLDGLGLIQGKVRRFDFASEKIGLKIPHMGWNYAIPTKKNDLFLNCDLMPRFYFTHSYWFDCEDSDFILSKTHYGYDFPSVVHYKNIYGVQFHPEKSHRFGYQILKNFALC